MQKHWEGYQKAIQSMSVQPVDPKVPGFMVIVPKETKPLASSDFGIDKTPNLFRINNTNVR